MDPLTIIIFISFTVKVIDPIEVIFKVSFTANTAAKVTCSNNKTSLTFETNSGKPKRQGETREKQGQRTRKAKRKARQEQRILQKPREE